MRTLLPSLLAALILIPSGHARADELKLSIADGLVTLIAADVPLRQILAEWARVGETTIVNGEKLWGPPMTLQLVDVPEAQALDALLRAASGYVAAPRRPGTTGASSFDRILILPTSRAPAQSAPVAAPPAFTRQPQPQPQHVPAEYQEDPAGEPDDMPGEIAQPGVQPVPGAQGFPGGPEDAEEPPPVLTAPRPGMLPPVPGGVPRNPSISIPGQQPGVRPPVQPGQPQRPIGGAVEY
jgi:hypothetical protein